MPTDKALPLEEVLRRCHRDELLSLADELKVNPLGLGRDRLARVLETALRAAGANRLENLLLRQGQGPDYPRILAGLAERRGLQVLPLVVETELALLRDWQTRPSSKGEHAERLARVLETGAVMPSLPAPRRTMNLPRLIATALASTLRLFAPLIGPMVAISVLLWLARPRDEILLPAVLHIADLRRRVSRRFTIGVVGPPSSGKDAALGALFGIQTGNVHPVAGSTREVTVYRIAGDTGLQVVNTPGVGDVIEALTEEARAVLDQIDVFLFLVNAQGGVRTRERNEFALCRARRRPLLVVVNKIDTLKAEDRERFLEDTRLKLAQPAGGVMAAAFDPLPALSPIPLGLDPIKAWLRERLVEMGRDPAWIP